MMRLLVWTLTIALSSTLFAAPPEPRFRAVTIDAQIQIGYGLAVADVDGDGRPDVLLADKRQIVWYQNPGQPPKGAETFAPVIWAKHVIAENLTEKDHVCIAAQDIDGDGKCEIAVGAEWNPGDTVNSGAVFYLIPPADRTQRWEPVKFPAVEPTTHRMRWVMLTDQSWGLLVLPLHGRGNKNGEGAPVKVLLYHPPADPRGEWKSEVVNESMHMTHNFAARYVELAHMPQLVVGGKEGVTFLVRATAPAFLAQAEDPAFLEKWKKGLWQETKIEPAQGGGAGEVRQGYLVTPAGSPFLATIEPMHGNQLVTYLSPGSSTSERRVLTDRLVDGHALASGDLLGLGGDQIVVGWRGKPGQVGSTTGVALWAPLDSSGRAWRESVIDPDGMACEDLLLADLNADGKLDIVAAGRATKNVKIYFNETGN